MTYPFFANHLFVATRRLADLRPHPKSGLGEPDRRGAGTLGVPAIVIQPALVGVLAHFQKRKADGVERKLVHETLLL